MILVLMGVSGSGKTTIGEKLAQHLGWPYHDADAFHPAENKKKMAAGRALDDADRAPWLAAIRRAIRALDRAEDDAVFSCSALKQAYRDFLFEGFEGGQRSAGSPCRVCLVYLRGSREVIRARVDSREGHFAKGDLVQSQFDALEEPAGAVTVDVDQPPERIIEKIAAAFGLSGQAQESPS